MCATCVVCERECGQDGEGEDEEQDVHSVSLAVTSALSLFRTVTHSLTFIDFSTFVSHSQGAKQGAKHAGCAGERELKRANVRSWGRGDRRGEYYAKVNCRRERNARGEQCALVGYVGPKV